MGGSVLTVLLIITGVGMWLVFPELLPITLGNMRWHLTVTGLGAVLVGLGLSRTWLGR